MVQEIGLNAGMLWHYLEMNPSSTLEDAAKALKVKESLVAMSAGWLAREGKLAFERNAKVVRLSLKAEE